ncbi:hypothetical protein FRC02_001463 [Tulasnella sp. 418]|nr:hypothetical protein FRC02_001463 [Tulasnella sp. 418]
MAGRGLEILMEIMLAKEGKGMQPMVIMVPQVAGELPEVHMVPKEAVAEVNNIFHKL